MERRGFLQTLAAGVAGFALDPERLLWTPGQKTIFIPPAVKPVEFYRVESALDLENGISIRIIRMFDEERARQINRFDAYLGAMTIEELSVDEFESMYPRHCAIQQD